MGEHINHAVSHSNVGKHRRYPLFLVWNILLANKADNFFCSFVKFKTPIAAMAGTWDPYPIAMEFQPPCMVLSTIGLEKPGKLDGSDVDLCATHLHQLHVCMPSSRGKTRLLYRMALDFAPFLKHVPFINHLWQHLANKVSLFNPLLWLPLKFTLELLSHLS